MRRFCCSFILLVCLPALSFSQRITYSEPVKEDSRDINFEIIGKLNGNLLVFKNARWKYAITVYDNDMQLKEKVQLDFLPDKTFNVDFVAYPDFFYLIYQYQRKGIVYCMGVKMGADGKKMNEPVQLDTTQVGTFGDNKIYSTINSEDKQKIMVFKIQKKNEKLNFVTILFDGQLQLIRKSRHVFPYDEGRDIFSDFLLDNEGGFVFAAAEKSPGRDFINQLSLITKAPLSDTFVTRKIDLQERYIDELKLKIDNVNKRYLVNSFYYKQKRGNIEGLYYNIWDKPGDSSLINIFLPIEDSIRSQAKTEGGLKTALNDFFIRNIIVKRDGGYILMAEEYEMQTRGNNNRWNRWDYLYNSPYMSSYDYYMYSPSYNSFYRPFSSFPSQTSRYFCNNILVLSIDQKGKMNWSNVVHKEQYDDDTDNYLSFVTFNTGGEIHFLFNEMEKRDQLLSDNSVTVDGKLTRNPTLKSMDKGYTFMPKFGKQVGARQVVMPCTYRNLICFARIDY